MMYNVRCLTCKETIGKGVRFNARKETVGKYLDTEIYLFTMRCTYCKSSIKIQTNPKEETYDIVEGIERFISDQLVEQTYFGKKRRNREELEEEEKEK